MNNGTIKKWLILLALLLVTLVLVWQAPKPEQETPVVSATRNTKDLVSSTSLLPAQSVIADDIELKQRQIATEKVDLFDRPKIKQPVIAMPIPAVKPMPVSQVPIPFRYIGMLQEHQRITLFLLEGNRLYLANEGDTFNDHFQLQSIDVAHKQLVWLYLPTNEIRKMSIEK